MENIESNQILALWEQRAAAYKEDGEATMPDYYLHQLEIQNLIKYIGSDDRLLDVGCGNGLGTMTMAEKTNREVVGLDFSPEMIRYANNRLASASPDLRDRVRFIVGSVLELSEELGAFDKVTSARCLINLPTHEDQHRALLEIHRVLRPGGRAVLSEDSVEGMEQVNALRHFVELPDMAVRWHNRYLEMNKLLQQVKNEFRLITVDNFSSTYYLVSRVVYARLAADQGTEPRYDADINRIAARLPSSGDGGLLKIIVLEKGGTKAS